MFYIHRSRSSSHRTSARRPKRRFAAIGFALLIVVSTITSVPLFTSSPTYAATTAASKGPNDFAWQTKSFLYYRALAHCFKYSGMAGGSAGFNANTLSTSQANEGRFFTGGGPLTGQLTPTAPSLGMYMRDASSGDSMEVGTDGKVNCNNTAFVKAALSHWGVSATELLCESGFRRATLGVTQSVEVCKQGNTDFERREGGMDNNAAKFAAFIRSAVYGGQEPGLTDPQWYVYYRHSLSQSCISGLDSKPPGSATLGADNQYGYNDVKWVDITQDSVPNAVKTGSYVGTWQKNTNVALRVGEASSFNNFERSCSQTVTLMNNYANAYAQWAISNPTAAEAVENEVLAGNTTGTGEGPTSCVVEGTGWIICSIAKTMAQFVDGVYGLLVSFLAVQPLNVDTGATDNFVYRVWTIMQGLANILFVIAFLIIIFSQLTSVGISNYGVKKLLPRLVVSAVLVNTSFWISAILVDMSNLAGAGIYNLIQSITDGSLGDIQVSTNLWEDVVVILLSAGAIVGAANGINAIVVAGAAAAGGAASAALWSMLPVLLTVVLAVIVAFAVLAARQALIIILIILSPLAFVAYLLPNTENLFKLWKNSLTTMLIFYPLFAIIFAGSQLAAFIIIGSIPDSLPVKAPMVILGLFVMVAPLILTPLLIKFSGGLIGQLAGKINNSNKGLIDRSKKVAERKRGLAMGEVFGSKNESKNPFVRGMRGAYRRIQNSGRLDAERRKAIDALDQAAYDQTRQQLPDDKNGNPKYSRSQQAYNSQQAGKMASQASDNDARTNFLGTAEAVELTGDVAISKVEVDKMETGHEVAGLRAVNNSAASRNLLNQDAVLKEQKDMLEKQRGARVEDHLRTSAAAQTFAEQAELAKAATKTYEDEREFGTEEALEHNAFYQQLQARRQTAKTGKDMVENEGAARTARTLEGDANYQELQYRKQAAGAAKAVVEAREKADFRESVSGSQAIDPADPLAANIAAARTVELETNVARDRLASAEGILQQDYAQALTDETPVTVNGVQTTAGAVLAGEAGGIDPRGQSRVVNRAEQVAEEARRKAVSAEFEQLSRQFASPTDLVTRIRTQQDANGQPLNQDEVEAMIQFVAKKGTASDIIQLTDTLSSPAFATEVDPASPIPLTSGDITRNRQIMQVFGQSVAESGKVGSISGGAYGNLAQGQQISSYNDQMLGRVNGLKYRGEGLAKFDIDEIKLLNTVTASETFQQNATPEGKISLYNAIEKRLKDPLLSAKLNDEDRKQFITIQRNLGIDPSAAGGRDGSNLVLPSSPGFGDLRVPHDE